MAAAGTKETNQEVADAPASLPGLCPSNYGICCQRASSEAERRSNMEETPFLPTVTYLTGKFILFLSSPLPGGFLVCWLQISDCLFDMSLASI